METLEKRKTLREKVLTLQAVLLTQPQLEIALQHYFSDGLYLREMAMPKNSVIIGKIHKTEHYCVLAKGSVTVVTDEGRRLYRAPAVIHSLPGVKRALYAHEDVTWINVHHNPTNEKDLEKIEEIYVSNTDQEFLSFTEKKKLEGGK